MIVARAGYRAHHNSEIAKRIRFPVTRGEGHHIAMSGAFGLANFGAGLFLLGKCRAGMVRHGTPRGGVRPKPSTLRLD